ncbi:hypothetical protein L6164_020140 [Bauhinia variegata]|uniref:Uncharacterized protein n=1 Tax=Bauhinia variegata TaxID=167791 RepID=A0ACB9MUF8_BAUVA|nr:hypothetical protein L6164_020140 [Bauhinia variegata]
MVFHIFFSSFQSVFSVVSGIAQDSGFDFRLASYRDLSGYGQWVGLQPCRLHVFFNRVSDFEELTGQGWGQIGIFILCCWRRSPSPSSNAGVVATYYFSMQNTEDTRKF